MRLYKITFSSSAVLFRYASRACQSGVPLGLTLCSYANLTSDLMSFLSKFRFVYNLCELTDAPGLLPGRIFGKEGKEVIDNVATTF